METGSANAQPLRLHTQLILMCEPRSLGHSQTAFLLWSAAGRSDSIVWQAGVSPLWKGLSQMEEVNRQTGDQKQGMDREDVGSVFRKDCLSLNPGL